jgi:nucleoside-diphosphate-sugar epimerase
MFNWQAERAALEANKPGALEVVVVRPGMVYGGGGWFRDMVEGIRAGTYRVPGPGANRWSPLEVGDCGEAVRAVLERGKAGEAYLAADDEPVTLRAFVDTVADALRAPRPAAASAEEAIREHGEATARHLMANQAISAAKLKELGWAPKVQTSREGVPRAVAAIAKGRGY